MKYKTVIQIDMHMFFETIKKYFDVTQHYTIFEIGSRDGNDARILKNYFPNSIVYAFEASDEEYKNHIEINKDINWINLTIYNEECEIDFHYKTYMSGVHSIKDRGLDFGESTIMKVLTKRVDTFCKEEKIKNVDIVKIDVEGCTFEVLNSFGEYLKNVKALHIETERIEYFKDQTLEKEVFEFLIKNGFILLEKNERIDVVLHQSDSIWINNKLLQNNVI